jgi:ADP-heptose:LPS heptosyltransferase
MLTLIVPPADLAQALQTSHLIATLHEAPGTSVHVLCADALKPLFECMKGVQAVHHWSGDSHVGVLRSQLQVARQLRKFHFSLVLVLNEQRRWPALVLAMGSQGQRIEQDQTRAAISCCLHAPNIDNRYLRRKFGVSALMPMVLFHQQPNDWPTRYWVELLNLLAESGAYQAVFIGDTAHRAKATEICAVSHLTVPSHNLCGLTNLRDTLGLLACARVTVGTTKLHTQLSLAMGSKTVDMANAPLSAAASPSDVLRAIESTLAGDPSHSY